MPSLWEPFDGHKLQLKSLLLSYLAGSSDLKENANIVYLFVFFYFSLWGPLGRQNLQNVLAYFYWQTPPAFLSIQFSFFRSLSYAHAIILVVTGNFASIN